MFHELSDKTKNEILWKLTAMDLIISKLEKKGFEFFPNRQSIINENNKIIIKNKDEVLVEFDFNNDKILLNFNNEKLYDDSNYNYYNELNQNYDSLNQNDDSLNQNDY